MENNRVWIQNRDTRRVVDYGELVGMVTMYQYPNGDITEQDGEGAKRLEYPVAKIVLDGGGIVYGSEVWWGRLEPY